MSNIRFSIIICTRNRPMDLNDCLQSLSQQSYQTFEIIIVDASDNIESKMIVKHGRAVTFSARKPAEIEAGRQSEPNNGIIRASVEFIPCPEM